MRDFSPKTYGHLFFLPGFSEVSIRNHLTLYQG